MVVPGGPALRRAEMLADFPGVQVARGAEIELLVAGILAGPHESVRHEHFGRRGMPFGAIALPKLLAGVGVKRNELCGTRLPGARIGIAIGAEQRPRR